MALAGSKPFISDMPNSNKPFCFSPVNFVKIGPSLPQKQIIKLTGIAMCLDNWLLITVAVQPS